MSRFDINVSQKFDFSREYAKEIIKKGFVMVDNIIVLKPSFNIEEIQNITIKDSAIPKYVSRAGLKLEGAIHNFNLKLNNKTCLDVGASTGGFCDCLLQNNVHKIYAVDVGTNQLHRKILEDDKVTSFENMDIRNLILPEKVEFICVDVSFISITKILEYLKKLLKEDGQMLLLIKPQFESISKRRLTKNGIVKDKNAHINAIKNIANNINIIDITYSKIKGSKGNIEYVALVNMKGNNEKNIDFKDIVYNAFANLK